MNWLTIAFICLVLWAVYRGWRRRFAAEAGYLVWQIIHFVAGLVALLGAWLIGNRVSSLPNQISTDQVPSWAAKFWAAWQQSPQIAHLVIVVILYFVISSILHAVVRPVPTTLVRLIPKSLADNRYLGGALGAIIGVLRGVLLGAAVFLILQFVDLPGLESEATASTPYQSLNQTVYEPWLKPFVAKELPVLTESALRPLAENISLFAVPTGQDGQQVGVLVVPKEISDLAHNITKNQHTDSQKAHALYEWEIHHIHYDWNKYNDYVYHHKWDQQSPVQTLHTGKGVCADYALLYAEMAHAVGLSVEIDEGIGGTASQYGPHAWNRVYDNASQHWLYVDTTWGAEQDEWFNPAGFSSTHQVQTQIKIEGNSH